MRRLLVCGFGPFPGAPHNPAAAVVDRLAAAGWAPPATAVFYEVIPTAWLGSPDAADAAARSARADMVLLVGVAGGAEAFRVETLARNWAGAAPDADACPGPDGLILAGAPPTLPVPFDVIDLASAVSASGVPVELSSHAGDYLCNFTLYRMLSEGFRAAFLHVPMARECDRAAAFSLDEVEAAVRAAVVSLAGQA